MSRLRPKVEALIHTHAYYGIADMIKQYKTHNWGLYEFQYGALFHAGGTVLQAFDKLHQHFLRHIHCTEDVAFLQYNFAPPRLRRSVAILGLLHKRVLNIAHSDFNDLWPLAQPGHAFEGHNRQLACQEPVHTYTALYRRSIFGMIHVYNRLNQEIVDCPSIKAFQRALTSIARSRCQDGDSWWPETFHMHRVAFLST